MEWSRRKLAIGICAILVARGIWKLFVRSKATFFRGLGFRCLWYLLTSSGNPASRHIPSSPRGTGGDATRQTEALKAVAFPAEPLE